MTLLAASSRRRGGAPLSGWHASIPAADHAAHGAGYPLTYHFATPGAAGYTAQYRDAGSAWQNLPAAPAGRYDGIPVARFTGTDAYLSAAFPDTSPDLYLRILDAAGNEVESTFVGVTDHYDNRTAAAAFIYDDNAYNMSVGARHHAESQMWMSPAVNAGNFGSPVSAESFAAIVAGGYVEPANHTLNHVNSNTYTDLDHARAQIIGGKDAILAACAMPPQSRDRVHGYVYPYGTHSEWAYRAAGEAGHLSCRLTTSQDDAVEWGAYAPAAWSETWNTVPQQRPSVAMALGNIAGDEAAMIAAAQKAIDGVAYAKTLGGQCLVYSYIYNLSWTGAWPTMLATVSADPAVWSVGYGHLALYQRTRDRVTVTDLTT